MKRLYLFIIIVLTAFYSSAQEQKISVSFEDTPLKDAVESIEQITGLKFFYVDDW